MINKCAGVLSRFKLWFLQAFAQLAFRRGHAADHPAARLSVVKQIAFSRTSNFTSEMFDDQEWKAVYYSEQIWKKS